MKIDKIISTKGVMVPSSRRKPDPTTFLGRGIKAETPIKEEKKEKE